MIAEPGKGFVLAMKTFSRTRPMIGAFAVGAAMSITEKNRLRHARSACFPKGCFNSTDKEKIKWRTKNTKSLRSTEKIIAGDQKILKKLQSDEPLRMNILIGKLQSPDA